MRGANLQTKALLALMTARPDDWYEKAMQENPLCVGAIDALLRSQQGVFCNEDQGLSLLKYLFMQKTWPSAFLDDQARRLWLLDKVKMDRIQVMMQHPDGEHATSLIQVPLQTAMLLHSDRTRSCVMSILSSICPKVWNWIPEHQAHAASFQAVKKFDTRTFYDLVFSKMDSASQTQLLGTIDASNVPYALLSVSKIEAEKHATQIHELMTADMLNARVEEDMDFFYRGESLAFALTTNQKGRALLALDGYRLGKLITHECLNAVILHGACQGQSVAFWLAGRPEGRALLALDDYRLDKMITPDCLNTVISQGDYQGESVAYWLSASKVGHDLLARDDYRLGKMITRECLNAVVSQGPHQGQSVRTRLQESPRGKALLDILEAEAATTQAITPSFFDTKGSHTNRGTKRPRGGQ